MRANFRKTYRHNYRASQIILGSSPLYRFDFANLATAGTGFTTGGPSDLIRAPFTEPRGTTRGVWDHEDILREIPAGALAIQNRRVVRNRLPAANFNDFSTWALSTTGTGSAPVVTTSYGTVAINGVVYNTTRLQCDRGASDTLSDRSEMNRTLSNFVGKKIAAIYVRSVTGVAQTMQWNISGGVPANVVVPATGMVRVSHASSGTLAGGIRIGTRGGTGGDQVIDVEIACVSLEDVPDYSGSAPSEFVDPTLSYGFGANGFAYLDTENGNTVNANGVVTEATGAAISGAALFVPGPERENKVAHSYDLTNAAWTKTGTSVVALNATGLTGAANTASTLTDDNAAAYELVQYVASIADSSNDVALVVVVDKDNDETRFPQINLDLTGGTAVSYSVKINTKTGAAGGASGVGSVTVEDGGDYWWVTVVCTNNGTGNTTVGAAIYAARGTTIVTNNTSAVGSIVDRHVEINDNASTRARPIITNGSALTVEADDFGPAGLVGAPYNNTDWEAVLGDDSVWNGTGIDMTGAPGLTIRETVPNSETLGIKRLTIREAA